MQSLFVLGRQPAIGLAELVSLYGEANFSLITPNIALCKFDTEQIDFKRLGGSIKLAKIITTSDSENLADLENIVANNLEALGTISGKKTVYGLSFYNLKANPKQIMAKGLLIKKALIKSGHKARFVANQAAEMGSAQIIHNGLLKAGNFELIVVKHKQSLIIARAVKVQAIDAYAARDQQRPKRDAKVGMLPPKLAQILVNLSSQNQTDLTIYDPFCGTGVILQEASLMGFKTVGSDIDERMVEYSDYNLNKWLKTKYNLDISFNVFIQNAETIDLAKHPDLQARLAIASESYLGQTYTTLPYGPPLEENMAKCQDILSKFLKNLQPQLKPGSRLALAIPAWQNQPNRFISLPLIDQIGDLGYNRVSFKLIDNNDLIYYRAGQVVARQILILVRK